MDYPLFTFVRIGVHLRENAQKISENRLTAAKDKGQSGESIINKEIAYLSAMITWATNYIPNPGIESNPLIGFKRLKAPSRTRHVTDTEYWQQYEIAAETPASGLTVIFELTLRLAARGIEVRTLKASDCTGQGILVRRSKGSRDTLIKWSAEDTPKQQSRLYKAYKEALKGSDVSSE